MHTLQIISDINVGEDVVVSAINIDPSTELTYDRAVSYSVAVAVIQQDTVSITVSQDPVSSTVEGYIIFSVEHNTITFIT